MSSSAAPAKLKTTLGVARKKNAPTRIARPGEKDKLQEVLPTNLPSHERFFAALLRSPATDYIDPKQKGGQELWITICNRLRLQPPTQPIPPKFEYWDRQQHFSVRATLVLEEARHAIAAGLVSWQRKGNQTAPTTQHKHQQSNKRHGKNNHSDQVSDNKFHVKLKDVEVKKETNHSVLMFCKDATNPLTPDELACIRPGSVLACLRRGYAPTVENIHLGVVLPTNREEIVSSRTFPVMLFHNQIKSASPETKWELALVTSLLSEHRKFAACTADYSCLPFLPALLGGVTDAPHRNFEKEDDSSSSDSDSDEDCSTPNGSFHLPTLNPKQECAAATFLKSSPNTITLIQGPPG
jgi:hypothetical protein